MDTTIMTRWSDVRGSATARLMAVGAVLALSLAVFGGSASGQAESFTDTNATPIVVPLPDPPLGCPPACPSEKADPYPSEIEVTNLPGAITDVDVTLNDLTYELNGPDDLDIMLVGPSGVRVMLMSDACGEPGSHFPITTPITLTLDDAAAEELPADTACTGEPFEAGATFQPVDDDDDPEFGEGFVVRQVDGFPDAGPTPLTSELSSFNGFRAEGTWQLYVVDDWPNDADPQGEAGRIDGGWTLDVAVDPTIDPNPDLTTTTTTTTVLTTTTTTPTTTVPTADPATPVPAQARFTG